MKKIVLVVAHLALFGLLFSLRQTIDWGVRQYTQHQIAKKSVLLAT
ncbi:MAG: hypothetical protein Q8O53_01220 [Candidatus Moranbacteria bacterium]|nr:hypothetical protein [Candidatus Moranbacteria bacterium]